MKDFIGREIKQGSYIVYPGRQGSSLWMNLGHVVDVTVRTTWNGPVDILKVQPVDPASRRPLGKVVSVTCIDKVTVIDLTNASVA